MAAPRAFDPVWLSGVGEDGVALPQSPTLALFRAVHARDPAAVRAAMDAGGDPLRVIECQTPVRLAVAYNNKPVLAELFAVSSVAPCSLDRSADLAGSFLHAGGGHARPAPVWVETQPIEEIVLTSGRRKRHALGPASKRPRRD